eukprot:7317230-Prymnesium_polylepis.1
MLRRTRARVSRLRPDLPDRAARRGRCNGGALRTRGRTRKHRSGGLVTAHAYAAARCACVARE